MTKWIGTMRSRLAFTAGLATLLVLAAVIPTLLHLTSVSINRQVDASLRFEAEGLASEIGTSIGRIPGTGETSDGNPNVDLTDAREALDELKVDHALSYRVLAPNGKVILAHGATLRTRVPWVSKADLGDQSDIETVSSSGRRLRVVSTTTSSGLIVQAIRDVTDTNTALENLRLTYVGLALGAAVLAMLMAKVGAGRALRPAQVLARAAERVARERNPGLTVPESGGAELRQIAAAVNTMLRSLDRSRQEQKRFIDDAAHELRTPLTSLRTNIELVLENSISDPVEQEQLFAAVKDQLDEFTKLVSDLGELSRIEGRQTQPITFDLWATVLDAVARTENRTKAVFTTTVRTSAPEAHMMTGSADLVERAIVNILDNAAKFSPPSSPIDVVLDDLTVTVTDNGPGVAEADLPHVFDRFWRSPENRGTSGSGLGLAIVKDVALRHAGNVTLTSNVPNGTVVTLSFSKSQTVL